MSNYAMYLVLMLHILVMRTVVDAVYICILVRFGHVQCLNLMHVDVCLCAKITIVDMYNI